MLLKLKIVLFITGKKNLYILIIKQSSAKSIKLKTHKFWYFIDAMPEKISENIEI
jgi:hypothetical protein